MKNELCVEVGEALVIRIVNAHGLRPPYFISGLLRHYDSFGELW